MSLNVINFLGLASSLLGVALVFITLLLCGYAFFIKIKQSTYTDKRFHFVAFWASVMMFKLAFIIAFDPFGWRSIFTFFGLVAEYSLAEKLMIIFTAVGFMFLASYWARGWTGQLTSKIPPATRHYFYFMTDGAQEVVRIVSRQPPVPVVPSQRKSQFDGLRFPEPLAELSLRDQVRVLAVVKWPEFDFDETLWSGEASCWTGRDRRLNSAVLLVVAQNERALSIEKTRDYVSALQARGDLRVIAVFAECLAQESFQTVKDLAKADGDVYILDDFIESVVPLYEYEADIKKQFESNQISGTHICLQDTYVNVNVFDDYSGQPTLTGMNQVLDEWLLETSGRHLALLGDYGQGKSSEALSITYSMLLNKNSLDQRSKRIPILIRLTGLSPKTSTPEELLGAWGTKYRLDGKALLALHQAGRTVIIFDAFDEISDVANRANRFENFSTLWKFSSQNSKIVFTGRPNFFLDDQELREALLVSSATGKRRYCSTIRLAPFDRAQIKQSLRWLSEAKREAFLAAMEESSHLRVLAERPSLLFQLAQLWHHDRIKLDDATLNSATIIRSFIQYSFERQVEKQISEGRGGGKSGNFISLRLSELSTFTAACAVEALSDGRNNSLSSEQLHRCVDAELSRIRHLDLPRSPLETGALEGSLDQRLPDDDKKSGELCAHAVRTHGILEQDPTRNGFFKFSHKSFAEVLAAERIVECISRDSKGPAPDLSRMSELIQQKTIFIFLISLLSSEARIINLNNLSAIYVSFSQGLSKLFALIEYTNYRLHGTMFQFLSSHLDESADEVSNKKFVDQIFKPLEQSERLGIRLLTKLRNRASYEYLMTERSLLLSRVRHLIFFIIMLTLPIGLLISISQKTYTSDGFVLVGTFASLVTVMAVAVALLSRNPWPRASNRILLCHAIERIQQLGPTGFNRIFFSTDSLQPRGSHDPGPFDMRSLGLLDLELKIRLELDWPNTSNEK